MPNYIVKQHIDDLLKTNSLAAAKAMLSQSVTTIINSVTGVTYTLAISDVGSYVRKYYTTTHYVMIPLLSPSTLIDSGNTITVRNAGLGSLTLSAISTSTTINYDPTYAANIVEPNNTTQLLYLGNNSWDIV